MKRETAYFYPADILLPKQGSDLRTFSVVACDQYTSEPDYWERVRRQAEGVPSAYHLIFPEIDLKKDGFAARIDSINRSMDELLEQGYFACYPNSFVYAERTLRNGAVRRGLIGTVDLEQYDYRKGSGSLIRATEGTVLERIPPRVKIRENARLELPHIMLLLDDGDKQVIEPIGRRAAQMEPVYDFELMEESGRLRGWLLNGTQAKELNHKLASLCTQKAFEQKYQVEGEAPMLFAVGDGNHSLATAKACYEKLKQELPPGQAAVHPARYALVELVNLHDESLQFEAIHRVVFGADAKHLMEKMKTALSLSETPVSGAQTFDVVVDGKTIPAAVQCPESNLAVGTLQKFLDAYLKEFDGEVDYIHGEKVVRELCGEGSGNIGFLLPCMNKSELFRTVILDGALPRKTFSMGEACDKRFYLESRKIK